MMSPCRRICRLNAQGLCLGCGRTLAEIADWAIRPADERTAICRRAARRLEQLRLTSPEMTKRVLDVGQCDPDHGSIRRFLENEFSVSVDRAHQLDDALSKLRQGQYDLVLINRILDFDGTPGMDILLSIKADPDIKGTPVMMVSNYRDAQAKAMAAGAEEGFGKLEIGSPAARERLSAHLAS